MALILNIDTSTEICSAALASGTEIKAYREINDARGHASNLAVFIDEMLKEHKLTVQDLDAVAVSKGPGSYTGLRIGVSTAKGLCYGADKPLISVRTLQQMAAMAHKTEMYNHDGLLCSLIDARRMEVYCRVFDPDLNPVSETEALILDEQAFKEALAKGKVYFFGNGAEKAKEVITHDNAVFIDEVCASTKGMVPFSAAKFAERDFEDTAYFEPFYLKDFVATVSTKNPLAKQ